MEMLPILLMLLLPIMANAMAGRDPNAKSRDDGYENENVGWCPGGIRCYALSIIVGHTAGSHTLAT